MIAAMGREVLRLIQPNFAKLVARGDTTTLDKYLASDNEGIRLAAAASLSDCGERRGARYLVQTLGELGGYRLAEYLEIPNDTIRLAAAVLLANHGDSRGVTYLLDACENEEDDSLVGCFDCGHDSIAVSAAVVLANRGDPRGVSFLRVPPYVFEKRRFLVLGRCTALVPLALSTLHSMAREQPIPSILRGVTLREGDMPKVGGPPRDLVDYLEGLLTHCPERIQREHLEAITELPTGIEFIFTVERLKICHAMHTGRVYTDRATDVLPLTVLRANAESELKKRI